MLRLAENFNFLAHTLVALLRAKRKVATIGREANRTVSIQAKNRVSPEPAYSPQMRQSRSVRHRIGGRFPAELGRSSRSNTLSRFHTSRGQPPTPPSRAR